MGYMKYKNQQFMKTYWAISLCFIVFTSTAQDPQETQAETIAPKYSNEFLAIGVGADAASKSTSVGVPQVYL